MEIRQNRNFYVKHISCSPQGLSIATCPYVAGRDNLKLAAEADRLRYPQTRGHFKVKSARSLMLLVRDWQRPAGLNLPKTMPGTTVIPGLITVRRAFVCVGLYFARQSRMVPRT